MMCRLDRRWIRIPAWVIKRRWNDRLDGTIDMRAAMVPAGMPALPYGKSRRQSLRRAW